MGEKVPTEQELKEQGWWNAVVGVLNFVNSAHEDDQEAEKKALWAALGRWTRDIEKWKTANIFDAKSSFALVAMKQPCIQDYHEIKRPNSSYPRLNQRTMDVLQGLCERHSAAPDGKVHSRGKGVAEADEGAKVGQKQPAAAPVGGDEREQHVVVGGGEGGQEGGKGLVGQKRARFAEGILSPPASVARLHKVQRGSGSKEAVPPRRTRSSKSSTRVEIQIDDDVKPKSRSRSSTSTPENTLGEDFHAPVKTLLGLTRSVNFENFPIVLSREAGTERMEGLTLERARLFHEASTTSSLVLLAEQAVSVQSVSVQVQNSLSFPSVAFPASPPEHLLSLILRSALAALTCLLCRCGG